MSEFKKLTEKEVVESVSENGHFFAEDGGKIVRVPAAGVGGSGTVKAVIRKLTDGTYKLESGSFIELSNAIKEGVFPEVIIWLSDYDDVGYCDVGRCCAFYVHENYMVCAFLGSDGEIYKMNIYAMNNSVDEWAPA